MKPFFVLWVMLCVMMSPLFANQQKFTCSEKDFLEMFPHFSQENWEYVDSYNLVWENAECVWSDFENVVRSLKESNHCSDEYFEFSKQTLERLNCVERAIKKMGEAKYMKVSDEIIFKVEAINYLKNLDERIYEKIDCSKPSTLGLIHSQRTMLVNLAEFLMK